MANSTATWSAPASGSFFCHGSGVSWRREIRAQFEAFRATGLALDHVNAHKHMHLHPSVAALIIEIGRDYGMKAVRVPAEPVTVAAPRLPAGTLPDAAVPAVDRAAAAAPASGRDCASTTMSSASPGAAA